MKKRYLILAGLLVLAAAAAGCGKDEGPKAVQQQAQATPTAAPEPTKEPENLVDMQVTEEKNVIGNKTTGASKVTIINKTGDDVGALYIRQHPSDEEDYDDDEWGEDLIKGAFTLKTGDTATYYFTKPSGNNVTYDIRITYTEEDKNECFFRDLPLAVMKQITLRMTGDGEEAIPYATYMTGSNKKEFSTLNDVKKRLGLIEDENDSDDDENEYDSDDQNDDSDITPTPTPEETEPTYAPPEPTSPPDEGYETGSDTPTDDTINAATGYIGQSMDDLIGALGSPDYDEYETDPGSGDTGYHYYGNFTVSTSVDENGNEIVTGIW